VGLDSSHRSACYYRLHCRCELEQHFQHRAKHPNPTHDEHFAKHDTASRKRHDRFRNDIDPTRSACHTSGKRREVKDSLIF
jgi:hypothetical protein